MTARKKREQNKKKKAVDYLGSKCNKCGLETNCLRVYDFHHINPTEKDSGIARLLQGHSWDTIRKELDKCDLMCHNCHRIIHHYLNEENYVDNKRAERVRERSRAFKQGLIIRFGGKCNLCGFETEVGSVYEFHHLDMNKKESLISNLICACSWDKVELELKNCILVCANCHRIIHENGWRYNGRISVEQAECHEY
jgi:predicted HNH restriction endonuclease